MSAALLYAPDATDDVRRRTLDLEVQLAARETEIARLTAMYASLQTRLLDGLAAAAAARRTDAIRIAQIDELHNQLAVERVENAAQRDQHQRTQQRCDQLAAELAAQERTARRDRDSIERSERRCQDLESRLHSAASELAAANAALATAANNASALQQALNDALSALEVMSTLVESSSRVV